MKWSGISLPGDPRQVNEDWMGATPELAVVLDGGSALRDDTGCCHGAPWFVHHLGLRLLMAEREKTLIETLGAAIAAVADLHRDTCELTHPGTPSAAVAMVRPGPEQLEYLVLADIAIVLKGTTGLTVAIDRRIDDIAWKERAVALRYPIGSEAHATHLRAMLEKQHQLRNQPGGYWVAQSDPIAADHAINRTMPIDTVRGGAVLTDGVGRLVNLFRKASWVSLLDLLQSGGVTATLDHVRDIEKADPDGIDWPRYRTSDDATALRWEIDNELRSGLASDSGRKRR